jgi:hypothetical protein
MCSPEVRLRHLPLFGQVHVDLKHKWLSLSSYLVAHRGWAFSLPPVPASLGALPGAGGGSLLSQPHWLKTS